MAATMKDIARKTGLGIATVSSYFNGGNVREKNRVKIEEAISQLHFEVNEVARGLKTNKTKTIGIVIPELNNIFCAEIITEAEDLLRNHGYAAIICDCRTDERREKEAIEFLLHRRVDGLLLMPTGRQGNILERFMQSGRPVVAIDRELHNVKCDSVLTDNEGAAKDAVERLLLLGHREIGIIAGPKGVYTAQERQRGYCLAMEAAKISMKEDLTARGDYTIEGGAAAMKRLVLKNPEMTAVLVSNYEMTMGAVIAVNELGMGIPGHLSFIGFDNVEFARACSPRLSIVTQPTKEIAAQASALLLERLEKGMQGDIRSVKLKTSFVEGRSIREQN